MDEEERFAATGWVIGADEEFDEPDVYEREELAAWGFVPPEAEATPYVPPAGPTVTALVAGALGALVARHRRLHRWTQAAFAGRMGLDQPRVSRLERGRVASLTLATVAELALETGSVAVLELTPGRVSDLTPAQRAAGGTSVTAALPDGGRVRLMTAPAPVLAPGVDERPARPGAWAIP